MINRSNVSNIVIVKDTDGEIISDSNAIQCGSKWEYVMGGYRVNIRRCRDKKR